jgi:hypothetical protein
MSPKGADAGEAEVSEGCTGWKAFFSKASVSDKQMVAPRKRGGPCRRKKK